MSETVGQGRPLRAAPRGPCPRLIPPAAFLVVTGLCLVLNTSDLTLRWPLSSGKKPDNKGGPLFPSTRLLRSTESRDALLSQARETLEWWWKVQEGQHGARCPFSSTPGQGQISRDDLEEVYGSLKQGVEIMEAMGLNNLTTCEGRYPRLAPDNPSELGSPTDKIQGLLASVDIQASSMEELVMKKFCYPPTYRPPTPENVQRDDASEERQLPSDPGFCSRLLQLYRDITSGREPPLLTMFTWIPDPIEDPAKVSRRYSALNLDMFKPFVQPVLISDRRMVMAIANSIQWPCLPVAQLSPDKVPVFKPTALSVMGEFPNSTFYGYARGVSVFDASLLETLLAVKAKFLTTKSLPTDKSHVSNSVPSRLPDVFLFGSALFKQDLTFRSNYSAVGSMAKDRASADWPDGESSLTYLIHTKQAFSDLPGLTIEDKDLVPVLAERALLLGNRVIDASSTVLTVYNVHLQNTNEWNRIPLPSTPRIENYNQVMGNAYLESLRQKMSARKPLFSNFDREGKIVFSEG